MSDKTANTINAWLPAMALLAGVLVTWGTMRADIVNLKENQARLESDVGGQVKEMRKEMHDLSSRIDKFMGYESAKDPNGVISRLNRPFPPDEFPAKQ